MAKRGVPRPMNAIEVPAGPIQREIRAYLGDVSRDFPHSMSGPTVLALMIWPGSKPNSARRYLNTLLGQRYMRFSLADHILAVLDRTGLWYSDPVLAKRYPEVDLTRPATRDRPCATLPSCRSMSPTPNGAGRQSGASSGGDTRNDRPSLAPNLSTA